MNIFAQFRTAPNLLTLLRLFLVPFLVIQIFDGNWSLALVLFAAAGLSDGLDGLLARKLKQRTTLGEYLDPIADKLLLSTLFLVVTHEGLVPRYVTVLVFSRDLGILLVCTLLYVTNTLRDFPPSLLGKVNTGVQILTVILILVHQVWLWLPFQMPISMLLRAISIIAPMSAVQYAWAVARRVQEKSAASVA
ncbi:CDP-alcohol phosphatidyltransferase family protein [Terriglobus tenax]|uniref:CDP-alcohol phosphatidyltransferase family protein n=1 Tax=Terriglobus tenax TaxID=1111115 RepID=UPI0021DF5121|nr:CDP-alcohol phosphatidyltransferase family protein [Terriglobus tenax]